MIRVKVEYFAAARDLIGTRTEELALADGATAGSLLDAIVGRHALLTEWRPFLRLAVNREYAESAQRLTEGDEIAVIPPVSGG